jgi:hypothetical protein
VSGRDPKKQLKQWSRDPNSLTPTRRVSTLAIRYEYGFGFGDLYHPYSEVLSASTVTEGAAVLAAFYDVMETWRSGLTEWEALPVQAWRFGKTRREERLNGRIPSALFGPVVEEQPDQARHRTEKLFSLRDSIASKGYGRPTHPIDGVWVGRSFLVLGGQHRVAVLASLGWEKIPVKTLRRKNTPRKLRANRLPLVRSGRLPLDQAQNILKRVESGFSRNLAQELGFPFAGNGGG